MLLAAKGDLQWGDVATWAAALFTGGSLIGAVVVLRLQARQLSLQRQDLKDREELQRQDQARHVSAWAGGISASSDGLPTVVVEYRNGSEEPVYEAAVFVKSSWGPSPNVAPHPVGLIPPGQQPGRVVIQVALHLDVGGLPANDPKRTWPPVVMTFRDSTGQWWKRDEHGSLVPYRCRPDVMAEATPSPDPNGGPSSGRAHRAA